MKSLLITLACTSIASAQVVAWGQCGGNGYTGSKTCVAGYSCVYVNDWFWQCQQGTSTSSAAGSDDECPGTDPTSTSLQASISIPIISQPSTPAAVPTSSSTPTTFATSTSTSTSSSASAAASANTAVQYLGRVNPATKELSWPGTGLRFSYDGTAEIALTVTGSNSADLIIDGTLTTIPSVTDTIALPAGSHSVEFRKRSEASLGSIFVQMDGTPAANRLIEFIGDSITVGYGLDGTNPCTNSAQVEDNPKTYAALTANALGADYNVVAWSGKGIVRNISPDNGPLMTELWTRWGANDADNTYTFPVQAQAVVVALGTNDFTYLNARDPIDPAVYQQGVTNFIQTLQGKYPSAKIFLLSSPMLQDAYPSAADAQHTTMANALKNAAASASGVYFVDWPTQGSDVGCDYHPNAATHAAEAAVLTDAMRQVLGW